MRNIFLFIAIFSCGLLFSQHIEHVNGGHFEKSIVYNLQSNMEIIGQNDRDRNYNLSNKSAVDRVLFGNTNSYVEFVYKKSQQENGLMAFRIIEDKKKNSYKLELLRFFDLDEVDEIEKQVLNESSVIYIPKEIREHLSIDLQMKPS